MLKLLIASNNPGKLYEFQRLAGLPGIELINPQQAGLGHNFEVEETGSTFEENAILKARKYSGATGLHALGDDSGLEVEALGGEPGIYSKRYAGENATDPQRISFLLEKMKEIPSGKRAARFVAALALAAPDGSILEIKIGYCPGQIAFNPRGTNGFGYDPIFLVEDSGRTMAELSNLEKNLVSHRGNAARLLTPALQALAKS